jgi:branched-subunit amino acid aminotransferase/4-amino-4-deoxychorismate lyase
MVETFVLADGAARPVSSSPDLATASGALPAGAYTTLRTYGGDGIPFLDDHIRRLEESSALQGRPAALERGHLRRAWPQCCARRATPSHASV